MKVLPIKGVIQFGKKTKLSLRFVSPYRGLRKIGKVVYELDLPMGINMVHPIFHVSMLRECVGDPSAIAPLDVIGVVEDKLACKGILVEILDRHVKRLRIIGSIRQGSLEESIS